MARGHPSGYISYVEAVGETWYFRAPESVLSALPAAEHGTQSYSLKQSADQPGVLDDDIIIVGRAGGLSFRFPKLTRREIRGELFSDTARIRPRVSPLAAKYASDCDHILRSLGETLFHQPGVPSRIEGKYRTRAPEQPTAGRTPR